MTATTSLPIFAPTDDLLVATLRRFFGVEDSAPSVRVAPDGFLEENEASKVDFQTMLYGGQEPPFVFVKRERRSGTISWGSADPTFLQPAIVALSTFTDGRDADKRGAQLQEACRIALYESVDRHWHFPGLGHIAVIDNSSPYSRVGDYATSTGVVQYAALPSGWVRYESVYRLLIRPPSDNSLDPNPFVKPSH